MKYLYLTPEAINHFIVTRQYQSPDYEDCIPLHELLRGHRNDFNDGQVCSIKLKYGVLLYKGQITKKAGLFFDYEQFTSFLTESPARVVTIFQKTLRFATRYFDNRNFVQCELVRDNNGIIFPFPYIAHGDAYRVVADRNGYRNGKTLNFLTVYYGGTEETNRAVNYVNLNQFYEEFKGLETPPIERTENIAGQSSISFSVKELESPTYHFPSGLNDSDWMQYLTKPQKEFVCRKINGAERLEGAAGTGKTLSMVLKCIYNLKLTSFQERYIFITHSLATKNHIKKLFIDTCPELENRICEEGSLGGNLLITTVQEWCIKYLGTNIADTEYLDKDAMASKNVQKLYIESALKSVNGKNLSFYKHVLSEKFLEFLENTDVDVIYDMLQYEFGVVLKGRADGDLDQYKRLERPQYGIPCSSDADFNYLHLIYSAYQNLLIDDAQFDSDDIVLSALSSLNAPIWRRRREREGFDACFIDETHLFNFNEMSVFPFLNKTKATNNIIFAIDKSQFGGEILQKAEDVLFMSDTVKLSLTPHFNTVFRSSSSIVNLAFNIMSIGTTLFNNFENPLEGNSNFTDDVDPRYRFPNYEMVNGEDEMFELAIKNVESYQKQYDISKADCLIVCTSDLLCANLKRYCETRNKPYEEVVSRGDSESIERARKNNKLLIAGIDYVGGLEFDYVFILGVDDNRVPPKISQRKKSFHFSNYAWHRRMYVAITRARFGLFLIGDKVFGKSFMFENAIINGFVEYKE